MAMQTSKEVYTYLVDHLTQLGLQYTQLGQDIAAQEAALGIRVQNLHDILTELAAEKVAEPARQQVLSDLAMRRDDFLLAQDDVMREHASDLDLASRYVQSFSAGVARLASARQDTMCIADTFTQAQDALRTKVATDPEIQKLRMTAIDAHNALRTARNEHTQQATTTSDELKIYENHKIFMMLVDVNFGTPAYSPRWFMRPVHGVMARAVDFADKQHHYTHLTRRMRPDTTKLAALKNSLDAAVGVLRSAEAEAEVTILSPARGRLSQVWSRENDLLARVNLAIYSLGDLHSPSVANLRPKTYNAAVNSYLTFDSSDVFGPLLAQSATDARWAQAAVFVTEIDDTNRFLSGVQRTFAGTGRQIGRTAAVIRDFVAHGYHLPIFFDESMSVDELVRRESDSALRYLAERAWMSADKSQHYIPVQPDVLLSPPKLAPAVKPSNGNGSSASARAESEHPVAKLCAY